MFLTKIQGLPILVLILHAEGIYSHDEISKASDGISDVIQGSGRGLLSGVVSGLKSTLENTHLLRPSNKLNSKRKFYHKHGHKESLIEIDLSALSSKQTRQRHNETYICNKLFWNMEFQNNVTFVTENFGKEGKTYSANTSCVVLYQGSRSCIPVISCETPIDLRKRVDGSCKDDYLYIRDGLGGGVKYCDNDKISKLRPSNDGKDFYIQLVTGPTTPSRSYTGFKCTIACRKESRGGGLLSGLLNSEIPQLKASKKTQKIIPNCVCGLKSKIADDERIVGGTTAAMNEFPWLVAIVLKGTRQPICGGAIINDRHILTAAHCFVLSELTARDVEVIYHAHLLDATMNGEVANVPLGQKGSIQGIGWELDQKSDADENSTRLSVEEVTVHPMFNDGYDNDVAIMRLSKKIDLTTEDGATPICLQKFSSVHDTYKGQTASVAGWGMGHEDASASNRLLQKLEDIPIVDHDKCKKLLINETVSDKMMCAGFLEGGKDSCTGDSGGPLVLKKSNDQFTQIGIVSWGSGCARKNYPGIYTDVQELLEWIGFHTSDPNVQWCRESANAVDA